MLVFLVLGVATGAIGLNHYQRHKSDLLDTARLQTEIVRDLTAERVTMWRNDRIASAEFAASPLSFRTNVAALAAGENDPDARREVQESLDDIISGMDHESAILWDTEGKLIGLSAGVTLAIDVDAASTVALSGEPALVEIVSDSPDTPTYVAAMAPIRAPNSERVCAVLVTADSARDRLFYLVSPPPDSPPSLESLVVRRVGYSIVFMHELRFDQVTDLQMVIPLALAPSPAAAAAREESGTMVAADYRGEEVVAAFGPVPDSPWAIVSKVDTADVLSGLRRTTLFATGLAAFFLVIGGAGTIVMWRGRERSVARTVAEGDEQRVLLATRSDLLTRYANDGILLVAEDLTISESNERARELYGCSEEDLAGTSILDLQEPADRERVREALEALPEGALGVVLAVADTCKHGPPFDAEISARRIDLAGEANYMLIIRDITERSTALRLLEARTEALTRTNEELQRFAYVASHDLQEPLRQVTSYSQLIQKRYGDALDSDGLEFLGYMTEGAERMQAMVSGLLEYSQVDRTEVSTERLDLDAALADAIANLGSAIEETGAEIDAGTLPHVVANRAEMVRLFQNLIGNAVKFHRDGVPPQVRVTATHRDGEWTVSVADNGIGIEAEYLERAFVVFLRLESRERFGGTGIGLAICRKIVERLGGRIWIESVPDEGTTVLFTVPDEPAVQGRNTVPGPT